MFSILLFLSVFFFVLAFVGGFWGIIVRGKTEETYIENEYGMRIRVVRKASYSNKEVKEFIKSGNLKLAMPPILIGGGLLGSMLFSSLFFLIVLEDLLFGVVLMGMFGYAVYLMVSGFRNSDQA